MTDRHEGNAAIQREFVHSLLGELIGEGIARRVFRFPLIKDCVIKIEDGSRSFQNVIEWEAWERVRGTSVERWFAPCEWISSCGSVLLMKRTTPAYEKDLPGRLPVFLTDTKRSNYGMYKGRLVCHDYGTHILIERGMSKATRKVEWWD